jgi:hypothetical protein
MGTFSAVGTSLVGRPRRCSRRFELVITLGTPSDMMAILWYPDAKSGSRPLIAVEEGRAWYGFFCDRSIISSV